MVRRSCSRAARSPASALMRSRPVPASGSWRSRACSSARSHTTPYSRRLGRPSAPSPRRRRRC
eukprot:7377552-Prymnesium_polylepis.1